MDATTFKPYSEDQAAKLKKLFGAALLRHPNNPFAAAREIEPTESTGRANWIANNWVDDPAVLEVMGSRVAELGALAGLPSKEEFALALYRERENVKDPETKLRYMRTFAEVMGYIEKGGGTNVNVNNNLMNMPKVMLVPQYKDMDQWQAEATAHHKQLTNEH